MANPPPDGMNDDFFDQIFSMPAAYGGAGDGGALSYGDSSASAAGFNAGGPSMFSLGLSLDQQQQQQQVKDAGGKRIRDDDQEVKRNPSEAVSGSFSQFPKKKVLFLRILRIGPLNRSSF